MVSAGQYGYNLDQLLFTVDPHSGEVLGVQSNTLPLRARPPPYTGELPGRPGDGSHRRGRSANAQTFSAPSSSAQIDGPFNRAKVEATGQRHHREPRR